ncbi:MAG: SUMF1/EgtB/PvdO family nonheme iron enzyme [Leptolyngbya sp. SIO1E4]|nr:SUMF1/EgtB/PvdO family nonheme iron enzyme [Leptolyngbya sp. SIO1E4]
MSRNWAICIGINEYYNLQPLQYAVQDADSVRNFFLQDGQFEQVYYFADDAPAIQTPRGPMRSHPTYANLKRFLRERFQKAFLDVGDNFWFFFAGHGELHEGHDYLMPVDVDPGNLEETALRISDITAYLRNCGADNTVLLLDACRSQGRRRGLGLGTEEQKGMVTVYSCSPRESSYEIDDLGHGAFTYALLEGFKLQGATNCATVERLDQYLRYQVPRLNAQHGKPTQTPYTAVEPLAKNHLILLPRKATLEDVLTLKTDAQEAELENELDLAEQLWIRVLAASPADRPAISALQRIALKRVGPVTSPSPGSVSTAGTRSVTASTSKPRVASAPTFEFEATTIARIEQAGFFWQSEPKVITQTRKGRAEYRREDLGNGVTLDLVRIPEGTFTMGSPADEEGRDWYGDFVDALKGVNVEGPQHQVRVPTFLMGKYPVTQAQWRAVVALPQVERDLDPEPAQFKGDNRPVERVNWDDAVEFCQRLSRQTGREYRLPSEAEWEYACRARTTTPFHFGPTITTDLGNYRGTDWDYEGKTYSGSYGQGPKGEYRHQTTDVGSFPANAFGLYDMHGNVWEWCLDHWHQTYEGAPTDGSAWLSPDENAWRLLRGGSWNYGSRNCRSANRNRVARVYGLFLIGFRVVCASSWALA